MNNVLVSVNYLGIYIDKNTFDKASKEVRKQYLSEIENFLAIKEPSDDTISRYLEITGTSANLSIFPHSNQLFEKLLSPLKSAKRCYCLGEYLATIELCSHVAEMLAQLIWEMTDKQFNNNEICENFEKNVLGSTFGKLGQERRVKVLRGFSCIDQKQKDNFDKLRVNRKKHFHLWDQPTTALEKDAKSSFIHITSLTDSILQISYEEGEIKINPLLSEYIKKNSVP